MKTENGELLTIQELKNLVLLAKNDEVQDEEPHSACADSFFRPWSIGNVRALLAQIDYSDSGNMNR